MMLSDGEILEAIKRGHIVIDPFSESQLTPNGYDLSVDKIEVDNKELIANNKGKFFIPTKTDFCVLTRETVRCPLDISAQLWLKSKFARNGIQATFGMVNAGFNGTLTFGMFNGSNKIFEIPKGRIICQIIFIRLGTKTLLSYKRRSGNYKNQKDKIMK